MATGVAQPLFPLPLRQFRQFRQEIGAITHHDVDGDSMHILNVSQHLQASSDSFQSLPLPVSRNSEEGVGSLLPKQNCRFENKGLDFVTTALTVTIEL